ncbi:MAG: hypothetical protein ABIT71_12655 [Vicinamibacteraceae bacterium]
MAQLIGRFLMLVLTVAAVGACADDSPASPSRTPTPERPAPTLPPLAEGRYRLLVTALGTTMGCEVTTPGVPLGGIPPVAAGYFSQEVTLRSVPTGWAIGPESSDARTTLTLAVTGASWPDTPVVTGVLAGQADQRAYDGPALDAGDLERPSAFTGAVVPGNVPSDGTVMTGTVSGRLTFSSGWTGQVTTCRSAQLVLQRP